MVFLRKIINDDRLLPSYSDFTEEDINYSKITNKGNKYVPYWFGRNLAMKNLQMAGFITYSRNEPIMLTPKGDFDIDPNKGVKASGDGGIDGFAYCTDDQSLKTTRVAIQCKRYTNSPVGVLEVNNLRGAIDTHRADYGVLLTTSYFSREAIESSRTGRTSVTLIDGQKLVDLSRKLRLL